MHSENRHEKPTVFAISPAATAQPPLLDENKKNKKKTFTKKKIKILASVVCGNLFLGSCYSLMAPFFPAEAEHKGATATQYGMIFGIYQFVMCVSSPVYGKLVPKLKTGFMMKTGMLVSGICSVLFGTLLYAPPGIPFVALAFTIRITDALGAASFLVASYTILGCEFPDTIGRAMSVVETAFAFGLAGGPVLGGVLYQAGGFSVPFYTIGSLLLISTLVNTFLFKDEGEVVKRTLSARKIIGNINFFLDVLTVFTCFGTLGFNEATLEPHVRQFALSPTAVGGIFVITGIIDALAAPVWGFFAERMVNCQKLAFVACILMIICFVIIGPLPFLPWPTLLWVVILSQFLLGFGMAGEIICGFTHGMKEAVNQGFPDDEATYGIVSSVLFSSGCLGGFIGPSIGGALVDHFGYKMSTIYIVVSQTVLAVSIGLRLICSRKKAENSQDAHDIDSSYENAVNCSKI